MAIANLLAAIELVCRAPGVVGKRGRCHRFTHPRRRGADTGETSLPQESNMTEPRESPSSRARPDDDKAGQPTPAQGQGGIGHGSSAGTGGSSRASDAVDVPGPSLQDGDIGQAHDGRAHHGLTGDDGTHVAAETSAVPASRSTAPAADLGRARDRRQGISEDPAERTTGGDRPNAGGRLTGAEGGPRATVPEHLPGGDTSLADDRSSAAHGGDDAQRDEQI